MCLMFLKKYKVEVAVFIPLVIFLSYLGYQILYPVSPTFDPSMHAEIVNLIKMQGYPTTWQPYTDNSFTYPPLFHYISLIPHLFGLSLIDSVRLIGILIFISLPLAVYLFVSTFRRDAAILAAIIIGLIPLTGTIFLYGEFPELLALGFIVLLLYSIRIRNNYGVAIFTGLVVVSHVFMALIALLLFVYYGLRVVGKCGTKQKLLFILVFLVIASFWAPKYIEITDSVIHGRWHNTVYDTQQPFFDFWPIDVIRDFLFGSGNFGLILVPLALLGLVFVKDRLIRIFSVISLVFIVYHLPYTQLKILDLFIIPVALLASVCVFRLLEISKLDKIKFKGIKIASLTVIGLFVLFIGYSQVSYFNHWEALLGWGETRHMVPVDSLYSSAVWLGQQDQSLVRIYSEEAPSWVGILANKIPMYPYLSDLESFSDSYREQLRDRDRIKELIDQGGMDELKVLLDKWDVKYLFTRSDVNIDYLERVYSEGEYNLYRVI